MSSLLCTVLGDRPSHYIEPLYSGVSDPVDSCGVPDTLSEETTTLGKERRRGPRRGSRVDMWVLSPESSESYCPNPPTDTEPIHILGQAGKRK